VLQQAEGVELLVMTLLYGAGLRVMEGLRLRVKDLDFSCDQITEVFTMIYTHVLNRGGRGVQSPADLL